MWRSGWRGKVTGRMLLISLIVGTMLLLLRPIVVWWPLYRGGSRAAGALLVTNVLLLLIGASRLLEMVLPYDLSVEVWVLALFMGLVQLALAEGVFVEREETGD